MDLIAAALVAPMIAMIILAHYTAIVYLFNLRPETVRVIIPDQKD